MSNEYLTPAFAEELSILMGCVAKKDKVQGPEFMDGATRAPPLYFETEERTFQGVCIVCYKRLYGQVSKPCVWIANA